MSPPKEQRPGPSPRRLPNFQLPRSYTLDATEAHDRMVFVATLLGWWLTGNDAPTAEALDHLGNILHSAAGHLRRCEQWEVAA